MVALTRLLVASAAASWLIITVEAARTLITGATELGSAGQVLGFIAAVVGLLGLPLWLLGFFGAGLFGLVRQGAVFGGLAPLSPARRFSLVVFLLPAAAALLVGVQQVTVKAVAAFQRPVYQGLAAGLAAVALTAVLAAFAGPVLGAVERLLSRLDGRVPAALNPTSRLGGWLYALAFLLAAAFLAPVVRPELHTVDLRAARLGLLWLVALTAALTWFKARRPGWALVAGAGLSAAAVAGAFGWSAFSLGDSQQRLVALNRDTLLAGGLAKQLSRLGDRDGDGVPRLFAGGDCNDRDPTVRPGVYDRPQDGVDQNCTGADLVLKDDPLAAPPRPPQGPGEPMNVLFLTLDAVRADYVAEEMPRLSALAKDSVHFTNAYAHGAATYWSLPAILASTVPSRLEMGGDQTPVARELLFPEVLQGAGWQTALYANVTIFFVRGLKQGFDIANYDTSHFTVHGAKPGSAHLTDGILKHLKAFKEGRVGPRKDRFMVWAHYYDPHDPYFEVPGYPAADSSDEALYRAILRYVDAEVGRLIDQVKEMGLWENTLIVISADHGDEFLDHGHRFHGASLYEEMSHVPLILHIPGVPARTLTTPIGHMELAPTLLELLGVPIPARFRGRSRATEILTGKPAPVEPVYFEVFPDSNYSGHQVGVRLGGLKLIYRIDANTFELYDLVADPKERRNLYDIHPEAPALKALLFTYLDHHLYALAQGKTGAKLPPGSPAAKNKRLVGQAF